MSETNNTAAKPVLLRRRCLRSHHAASSCRACVDACREEALFISDSQVGKRDTACVGCGACVASCPTQAWIPVLTDVLARKACLREGENSREVVLSCRQTSSKSKSTVSCLQQIEPEFLLKLVKDGAESLVFRTGGCAKCVRFNRKSCVSDLIEKARGLVEPFDKVEFKVVEEEPEVNLGRRFLFGRIFHENDPQKQAEDDGNRLAEYANEPWKVVPQKRQWLAAFANGQPDGKDKSALLGLWKVPSVDAKSCNGCSMCVPSCPTGALSLKRNGEDLVFSLKPVSCIGCGVCKDLCFANAISLKPVESAEVLRRKEPEELFRRGINRDLFNSTFESKTREIFKGVPIYST